jgi:hypothetical protein
MKRPRLWEFEQAHRISLNGREQFQRKGGRGIWRTGSKLHG